MSDLEIDGVSLQTSVITRVVQLIMDEAATMMRLSVQEKYDLCR